MFCSGGRGRDTRRADMKSSERRLSEYIFGHLQKYVTAPPDTLFSAAAASVYNSGVSSFWKTLFEKRIGEVGGNVAT